MKRMVKTAAERSLDPSIVGEFSGHSLRAGAAQHLLIKGFDTSAIIRADGWKSVNVLALPGASRAQCLAEKLDVRHGTQGRDDLFHSLVD